MFIYVKKIITAIKSIFLKQYKNISDEFIDWLSIANAGMLHRGNLYCFEYAIKNISSENPIIEIGSFCGLSSNIITYYIKKHKKNIKIISSDKWIFEGAESGASLGNTNITHAEYRNFVIESYKKNVLFFSNDNLPYCIEAFSDDFFNMWSEKQEVKDVFNRNIKLGGKISFAYIDGNHSYENTKRDFDNISNYLEIGGFVLFDDSSKSSSFGCAKFMNVVLKNNNFKLVCKNPNYLFQKIK